MSDHFPIFYFSQCKNISPKKTKISYRDFSETNIVHFSESLRSISWNRISSINDVHDSYNEFSNIFHELYNLHFPLLQKNLNKNAQGFEPWILKGILISRLRKIALCKASVKNPSPQLINEFKTYRNLYNKVIKTSKKLYFQSELIKNQSNLKKTCLLLRKAVNNKSKKDNSIQNIIFKGSLVNNPLLMAEHFNVFYSKSLMWLMTLSQKFILLPLRY